MTPAEIESLLSKITPDPWWYNKEQKSVQCKPDNHNTETVAYQVYGADDGAFIAAAPQIVRQLLREREGLLNAERLLIEAIEYRLPLLRELEKELDDNTDEGSVPSHTLSEQIEAILEAHAEARRIIEGKP